MVKYYQFPPSGPSDFLRYARRYARSYFYPSTLLRSSKPSYGCNLQETKH
jgi:hypothetical protein